ncbi:unnamed protein product [Symbiodinium natans]|uniref:CSD domain-containing protein n=1 Tax=Symbiodinium natans TaxID=878477 RepID=A0A812MWF4_9DINO|nr:unnamed protein product [Symbiodinium natans]
MQGWPGQPSGLRGAQAANLPLAFQAMAADAAEEQEPSSKRQRSQDNAEMFPCQGGWPGAFGEGCGGSCGSGYGGASSSCSGAGGLDPMAGCACSGLGWGACGGMNPIQLAQMQQMAQMAMAAFATKAPDWKEDSAPENPHVEERYYGVIRDYNESQGFGFIECEDAKWRYGMDVFIHRRQMFGLAKGDEVSFVIVRNSQGQPQARHVIKKEETARILEKRKDREKREAEKLQAKKQASEKVFTPSTMEGKVMSEEEARRFQKSLKRGR